MAFPAEEPFHGGQSAAEDSQSLRMRTLDELSMALDVLLDRHLLNGIQGEDVVPPT